MVILARFIGIIFTAAGIIILLRPEALKQLIAFMTEQKRVYIIGCARIVVGAILLIAAPQCKISWVVAVIGAVAVLLGILIFVLGAEKFKGIIKMWQEKPAIITRLLSLVPIIIGILLISCA